MDARTPVCGRANQPPIQPFLPPDADPTILSRKGYLYVLADQHANPALIAEIRNQYYADTSLDTIPSLQRALMRAYQDSPEARESIPLVLVLQELGVFAVGTDKAAMWLARFDEIRRLLPNIRESRLLASLLPTENLPACNLYGVQQRLSIGDSIVVTTQPGAQKLTDAVIRRTLRGRQSADKMAAGLAKVASHRKIHVPVTVIHASGFTPIPDLGPAQQWKTFERPPVKAVSRGTSPIIPALIIAICAIAFSLWFTKTTISLQTLSGFVSWMLTPVPTETSIPQTASPQIEMTNTPTPQQPVSMASPERPSVAPTGRRIVARPTATLSPTIPHYPPPELISPKPNEKLPGQDAALRWAWSGTLGDNEYFDIRLWREGTPRKSIAWTKDRYYTERSLPSGWYSWTVVVIRGQNSIIEQELASALSPISFYLQGTMPNPTATTVATAITAPTRTTPVSRPTREMAGF